ncbi:protein EFFECTOR OF TRANSCRIPTION 2 [Canna indica]|uniref:Protein EFFECTOR OF TRANSCRIPTION 2 n=1 Tax=Canna indica TaxID=4628 RepID=A0AAQ3KG85_9LILI|nr:protein EFFECTOR OF TRANSCRIPTION 2 [Canna indica]
MVTATSYSSRLRREDCRRTKHDSVSSEWKVLIGPSDWEDYSLGKDGVERYRTHNLPANCSSPGFYELGIAVTSTTEGHNTRQHALKNIIVVYLGQADNVRIRLQQYGRAGSHLDHGKSLSYLKNSEYPCLQSGPGLFKEIFSRGYSIVYRWAPQMRDKKEAENMEKKLLYHFDYAWNKLGNGTCRREDIISRLGIELSKSNAGLLSMFYKWKQPLLNKKLGVKISSPLEETESLNNRGFLPQILKFMRYQPRSIQLGDSCYQDEKICGVAIGNGYICRNKPVLGNKRCSDHKGKRITGISRVTIRDIKMPEDDPSVLNSKLLIPTFHEPESEVIRKAHNFNQKCRDIKMPKDEPSVSDYKLLVPTSYDPDSLFTRKTFNYEYDTCGVVLEDSSVCQNRPFPGRKRCEMHKGQRITKPLSFVTNEHCSVKGTERYSLDEECNICGVISGDGSVCRSRPVQGRKRCEFHKGQRITEPKSPTSKKDRPSTRMHKPTLTFDDDICGVTTNSGYVCMRPPVPGRKRCVEHKGMRTTVTAKQAW